MAKISTDLLFRKEFRREWTDSGRQIGSWTCGRWDRTGKQKNEIDKNDMTVKN